MFPAGYIYLGIAIVSEVIGTSALKASDGFTRAQPVRLRSSVMPAPSISCR
jgi:multidrug transporter EmrE-like cation transporter